MSKSQLAWDAMKQVECFTVTDIANAANMEVETCRHLIKRLQQQGCVAIKCGKGVQGNPYTYTIKASNDAPTFGKGSYTRQPLNVMGRTGHQLIWNTLRINLTITPSVTKAVTKCSITSIRRYLLALEKAGYVRCRRLEKHLSPEERAGQEYSYKLIRNTGPKAPILRSKPAGCWDQNEQKFYPYGDSSCG